MPTKKELAQYPGFRYEGGKLLLRDWILPFIPKEGSLYVEPFAGRGNVFWKACQVKKYKSFWLNDIRMAPFFRAIQEVDLDSIPDKVQSWEGMYWREQRKLNTPLALVMEPMLMRSGRGILDTTVKNFQGGEIRKTGTMRIPYDVFEYTRRIRTCRAILSHYAVKITSMDYQELPWNDWDEGVFVDVDPPYRDAIGMSAYKPNDVNHEELVVVLTQTKAKWILSEYNHPSYVSAFGTPIARKEKSEGLTNCRVNKGQALRRIECLFASASVKRILGKR